MQFYGRWLRHIKEESKASPWEFKLSHPSYLKAYINILKDWGLACKNQVFQVVIGLHRLRWDVGHGSVPILDPKSSPKSYFHSTFKISFNKLLMKKYLKHLRFPSYVNKLSTLDCVFLNKQADIYFSKVIKVEGDELGGGNWPDDMDGVVSWTSLCISSCPCILRMDLSWQVWLRPRK